MHFQIYPDASGEHRWRAIAANGLNIGNGSEGYVSKGNARRALHRFLKLLGVDPATVVIYYL